MKRYSLYAAWLIATLATLFSLYYSEIHDVYPCKFCWYQRIFLFPLPILLFPIVYFKRTDFISYIISLPIMGLSVACYQIFGRPPCCFFEIFFPLISALCFLSITGLLIIALFKRS
ncbi:MAG: disulfide bond formation protein B [Chlamydiae bacterium]|nr:disulfide bond formation protein B [Chlamydiota bacterium]